MENGLIRLIEVVFSNGRMLSVSDKSDSINECTQAINNKMKLHILWVWQNEHEFIRQWYLVESLHTAGL